MAMTPPTPVPSVSPIIEEAPRPAPSRSSARPNARASLIRAAGSPSASPTGPRPDGRPTSPGTLTRNRVVPAAGSYRPGTPMPDASRRRAQAAIAPPADLDELADDRLGTVAVDASATWSLVEDVATLRPSCSTTAHLNSSPRGRARDGGLRSSTSLAAARSGLGGHPGVGGRDERR